MKKLEERLRDWEAVGKRREDVTYGMLGDGFSSIPGIPDEFYSAEDPADRSALWHRYRLENDENYYRDDCRAHGVCWRCGREGCGCD